MPAYHSITFAQKISSMKHHNVNIITEHGERVQALAPVIISASRATDIPAFYADWFFNRLEKGYVIWRNPFSGKDSYVSLTDARFIVFWSKNPLPLLPYFHRLKDKGIGCYIQFTLNDYDGDGLERRVPKLAERIGTFKKLVEELGRESVVWRFDPLILTDTINIDTLLNKILTVGDALKGYTDKLVFSFADIASYKKVGRNLERAGIKYREWEKMSMLEFASQLAELNRERWNYKLSTCAEQIDLGEFGIGHNRCINPALIARLSPNDALLQNFLFNSRDDKGQRKHCGCILAKDIGSYNTCAHGCAYCYANASPASALENFNRHLSLSNYKSSIL